MVKLDQGSLGRDDPLDGRIGGLRREDSPRGQGKGGFDFPFAEQFPALRFRKEEASELFFQDPHRFDFRVIDGNIGRTPFEMALHGPEQAYVLGPKGVFGGAPPGKNKGGQNLFRVILFPVKDIRRPAPGKADAVFGIKGVTGE